MSAKRKSTVLIPVNIKNNDVPHYTMDKGWCERYVIEAKEELAEGFEASNSRATEARWREWLEFRIAEYEYEWREPWEFTDTFKIEGYGRGRSAAYFNLTSQTSGLSCVMMMTDICDLVTSATIEKGVVTGRWIFCKRGANYGIKYLGPTGAGV